jgi:hypothetical protein
VNGFVCIGWFLCFLRTFCHLGSFKSGLNIFLNINLVNSNFVFAVVIKKIHAFFSPFFFCRCYALI